MNGQYAQDRGGHGFLLGLLTGACVGVGLAIWLAPRAASELRARAASSAKDLGETMAERLEQASAAVGDAREELLRRGRSVRDEVADAVVNGAGEVGRFAAAAKSDAPATRRSS